MQYFRVYADNWHLILLWRLSMHFLSSHIEKTIHFIETLMNGIEHSVLIMAFSDLNYMRGTGPVGPKWLIIITYYCGL